MAIFISSNIFAKMIAKRRWIRRLKWFSLPSKAYICDRQQRFFVDLADWKGPSFHVLNWGLRSYEPQNYQFLKEYFNQKPKGVFFDVGANVGIFSFLLARENKNLQIHAFEPDPLTYDCLKSTFSTPNFSNVHIHQVAVSDRKGKALLFRDRLNHGGHSLDQTTILAEGNEISGKTKVPTNTIDSFINSLGHPKIDILKMDIQGYEGTALAGASKMIRKQRPIVLMECYFRDLLMEDSDLTSPFRKHGYVAIAPKNRQIFELNPQSLNRLKNTNETYCDLAFVPREKKSIFNNLKLSTADPFNPNFKSV